MATLHILVSVLLCLSLTSAQQLLGQCVKSKCSPPLQCPQRDAIDCILQKSLVAGEIAMKVMFNNELFATEFGLLGQEVAALEAQIDSGAITDFIAVAETYNDIISRFRMILNENCMIAVRKPLSVLIENDMDATLDEFYMAFMRKNGPLPSCPHRRALGFALRGIKDGALEPVNVILARKFSDDMGELPTMIEGLISRIDSGAIQSISEIAEEMTEYLAMFQMQLWEGCAIFVRDDLSLAISKGFDRKLERFIIRFKRQGGTNPAECPMRDEVLHTLRQASEDGVINIIQIIRNPDFAVEFGALEQALTSLIADIRQGMVFSVEAILLRIRAVRSGFKTRVEFDPGCMIAIRDDLDALINVNIARYTIAVINFYHRRGGVTGLTGCPNRHDLDRYILKVPQRGVFQATKIINSRKYREEFGLIKHNMDALHDMVQQGVVSDRATITQRVGEFVRRFQEVCMEFCLIEDSDIVAGLLLSHFDEEVDNFCKEIPLQKALGSNGLQSIARKRG